jgi:O-methyltransferase involved in polyketide biosynthesis
MSGAVMHRDKINIKLSGVSKTLLIPLWGRAQLSKKHSSLINDTKAIELVEKIDYDFSTFDYDFSTFGIIPFESDLPLLLALKAKQFDDKIKAYIAEHPRASVVNIGAGLDTTFYRVDNGLIHWYDLDLPAVIELRKQLIPETDRTTYIAKSLLDPSWCKDIKYTEDGVFLTAGGVFPLIQKEQVEQFFLILANNLPTSEIVFDAQSTLDDHFEMWITQLPPDKQKTLGAAQTEALKGWWQKAPQNQKDALIATLRTQTTPHGSKWSEFSAWWEQLSTPEKEEILHEFRALSSPGLRKWALEDANEITKWDKRITVIDQFPLFKNIPRDLSWSIEARRFMDFSDGQRLFYIVHLRV